MTKKQPNQPVTALHPPTQGDWFRLRGEIFEVLRVVANAVRARREGETATVNLTFSDLQTSGAYYVEPPPSGQKLEPKVAISKALERLRTEHVQNNLHRLGALGSEDVKRAIALLESSR